MEHTGTAAFLASRIVALTRGADPVWLLSAFFAVTVVLTQPMSNQAAAVVVLPVAVQTAVALGLNPRTFAVMIAVAASASFITPLEPASLLVYGPGRYRFFDFLRVGLPLTVVIYGLAVLLLPRIWPLQGRAQRTIRTEYQPPHSQGTRPSSRGSLWGTPSTMNRYRCSPTGRMTEIDHEPSGSWVMRWAAVSHRLKDPTSATHVAPGILEASRRNRTSRSGWKTVPAGGVL